MSGVPGDATQSTALIQPPYKAGVNGLPKLEFSAANGTLLLWPLDMLGTGEKTIGVVAKSIAEDGAGHSVLSIKDITNSTFCEFLLDIATYQYETFIHNIAAVAANGVGYNNSWGTTLPHVHIHTYNGGAKDSASSYTAAYDGADKTVVASGAISRTTSDDGSIGARASVGTHFYLEADMYEIVVYNRVLSSIELNNLWGYFKNRYAM